MFQQNTAEIIDEYIKEATRETPNPTVSNNVPITKPCIKKETVCCSLPSSSNRVPVLDGCMNEETRPKKDRHKLSNATGGSPILVPRGSKPEPCFQPKFSLPQSSPITPVMCSYKEPVPEMSSVIFGSATSTTVSGSLLPRSTEPPFCSSWIPQETPHDSRLHYGEKSNNVLEDFLQRPSPKLHITEQPKQRGMRFRYKCEGRSAGSILGANSTEQNKTLPTIELSDCEGIPEVNVVTCVVWKDWPHRIHPHSLVGKDCHDGICEVTLKPKNNKKHSYNNLGIQCVTKRDIETSVEKKINKGFDPFKAGLWKNQEEVDMNVVRLCFQASYQDANGDVHDLEPVLSDPIYDKKSTNTSELKICRINRETGHCVGGEEVYMLCDKVQKEDIAVVFHREAWEAKADFSQADVHRQIAIVFKTPSYQDLEISEPVVVEVCLERVTDKVRSDPFYFTYLPKDHDAYGVDLKRKQGFPDVIGGLSSSDPHGIEAKRRKKKPTYKEHCFQSLEPVPPTPFILPVDSREYQEVSSSFPDNMNQEQMENTVGDFSSFPDNMNYNLPDHNWTSNCEIFLDPFQSFFEDYDPSQNLDPGIELASENTASLIANSMFPNQYKMEEFPQCLEFQGRKDPT